jgi:ribose transport system permease protein
MKLSLDALPFDGPTRVVILAIGIMIVLAGLQHPQFLSPNYLGQQLQTGAFLGIVAAGAMLVILLGHIDLSVPWTMTASATVATAVVGNTPELWVSEKGVLAGLAVGALVGAVNGFGVAFLRIPSMIWTLATNNVLLGVLVYFSGYYASASKPSPLMSWLGTGRTFGAPNVLLAWVVVSLILLTILRKTTFGRLVYLVGTSEETAFLTRLPTTRVLFLAFVFAGMCSAIAGMLLAGYSGQSYQRMGDPYLLPGIAAVVLGGTSLFGGRGNYSGTVAGTILITIMSSVLSVMQTPEAVKQIVYGCVIILMVGIYSLRERRY